MADNRYNVDDILQEVRAKREKTQRTASAQPAPSVEELLTKLEGSRPAPKPAAPAPVHDAEPAPAPKAAPEPPAPPVYSEPVFVQPEAPMAQRPQSEEAKPAPVQAYTPMPEIEVSEPLWETIPAQDPVGKNTVTPKKADAIQWNAEEARRMGDSVLDELEHRGHGMTIVLILQLIMLLGTVYLALASTYHLMLPAFLATSGAMRLWTMVGLVVISAFACGGTLGNGLISIFSARRSNDAYVTLTVFACLVQGSFMAARPELLENFGSNIYLPLAAGILFFNTWGRLVKNARQRQNCEAVCQQPPVEVRVLDSTHKITAWASELPEQAQNVLCMNPASSMNNFENELELGGHTEALAGVVAPITAGAALIMAVVAYFLKGDLYTSACIFTAALCITSPFAAALGSHLPLRRANQGLSKAKSALLGEDTAEHLAESDAVLLRCAELFPSGSVTLHGIKTFDKKPIDEAIIHAASVLCSVDNTLTSVFRGMIGSSEILKPVENVVSEDGLGLSAWVDGGRVLIGNRELLHKHGVQIPPQEVEEKLRAGGRDILYLSNFGSLSAAFIISYRADRQVSRQLALLEKAGIAILLHSTDPNVTPALVAKVYGISEEAVHLLPASLHSDAEDALHARETVPAGMVSGSFAGSLRTLHSAQRCMGTVRAVSVMLVLEVVLGFALITFLAYTGAIASLTWQAIGIFQLFWLLIILLVSFIRK